MSVLPTFYDYYKAVNAIENAIEKNDGTLEGFFEEVEGAGINVGAVMTSDIGSITLPIASLSRREPTYNILEVAPDNKEAEEWILKHKNEFKKRYGDEWEKVLYSLAWKLFGDKAKNKVE